MWYLFATNVTTILLILITVIDIHRYNLISSMVTGECVYLINDVNKLMCWDIMVITRMLIMIKYLPRDLQIFSHFNILNILYYSNKHWISVKIMTWGKPLSYSIRNILENSWNFIWNLLRTHLSLSLSTLEIFLKRHWKYHETPWKNPLNFFLISLTWTSLESPFKVSGNTPSVVK